MTRQMKMDALRNKTNFTPIDSIYAEIKNTLPIAQIGSHYSPRNDRKTYVAAFSTLE